ncbi:saccharopine dehydrogenase [Pontibacter qinzhouensis]|uniref:Saccharopine dehydrogenase n=1 Tax=Pontibacter qinzhouensis TaxID=2603253 RepID=A0A5C8K9X4_9BACT|nr:saccharopine dehydrogenase C-terminal domain-containing protein [Pontibacter qinzhouensis]TXK45924.1 saccharopine dehydrogenase [Pontibacter qinzhouensis]
MTKKILLLGAGRSATVLISYLLEHAAAAGWELTIGDVEVQHLQPVLAAKAFAKAIVIDVQEPTQRAAEVENADVVISLLPAAFHEVVARECLQQGKHLLTASYMSPAIQSLHEEALQKDILILMEAGLDPGIDHMSAMAALHQIRAKGGELLSFKSFTGGLVAPESDNNPWHYKFTWNPRNVVLAGQGTARYIEAGTYKYIPYHQLFTRTEKVEVAGYGVFEGYANRDSLSYRKLYGLQHIPTMLRGTLRKEGFCEAWNTFVQLGMTDDTYLLDSTINLTKCSFLESFLPPAAVPGLPVQQRVASYLQLPQEHEVLQKLAWLGLFSEEPLQVQNATPAQVLEKLLKEKWSLSPGDKDMIVMQHQFVYELAGEQHELVSWLVVQGEDEVQTAMAKTVGLPVGILAKLLLQGKITKRGVAIPTDKELYKPVLQELQEFGVKFSEKEQVK